MATTFEQRVRDAKTILQAHWRRSEWEPLPDELQDRVAVVMVCYAVQLELIVLHDQEEGKCIELSS